MAANVQSPTQPCRRGREKRTDQQGLQAEGQEDPMGCGRGREAGGNSMCQGHVAGQSSCSKPGRLQGRTPQAEPRGLKGSDLISPALLGEEGPQQDGSEGTAVTCTRDDHGWDKGQTGGGTEMQGWRLKVQPGLGCGGSHSPGKQCLGEGSVWEMKHRWLWFQHQ